MMLHSPIVAGGGGEPSPIRLRVLSLGAEVQSTTLALMAAHGHFGSLDCAIFADTGWEPAAVYEHLRWLMSPNVLPFPVHIVSARNLRESLIAAGNGERWASIPAFTRTVDRRGNISIGMIRRQCTTTSKIEPISRKVRELTGLTRKRSPTYPVVHQWLGISMDEVVRMKPSRAAWQLNRFPLIESRMTRKDCLDWLKSHGYPKPPKSACIGCPSTVTPCGDPCGTTTRRRGTMPWRWIGRSAPACVAYAARSSCIAPAFPSMKPICLQRPTTASSASGRMNARECAVYNRPAWHTPVAQRTGVPQSAEDPAMAPVS